MQNFIKVTHCFLVCTLKRAQSCEVTFLEFNSKKKMNWQTYPTSLAVWSKLCTSFLFLFKLCKHLRGARLHQYLTWQVFFHSQTFALRNKSHPGRTASDLRAFSASVSACLHQTFLNQSCPVQLHHSYWSDCGTCSVMHFRIFGHTHLLSVLPSLLHQGSLTMKGALDCHQCWTGSHTETHWNVQSHIHSLTMVESTNLSLTYMNNGVKYLC